MKPASNAAARRSRGEGEFPRWLRETSPFGRIFDFALMRGLIPGGGKNLCLPLANSAPNKVPACAEHVWA